MGERSNVSDSSKREVLGQISKYFGVSLTQTFVEFGVFALLEALGVASGIANTAAIVCSGSYNFAMNRNITFKASSNFRRSVALFVLLYLWNLAFGNAMLATAPDLFGISTTAVKAFCMCCQGVWGYLLCKHVIFR